MLRLGVSSAAMFAEPAVTEIEEVVRLIHERTGVRRQKTDRNQKSEIGIDVELHDFCILTSVLLPSNRSG